jgi:mono/diheme cytochrome c family protein
MRSIKSYGVVLSVLLMNIPATAAASEQNNPMATGEKLYQELCMHCHGKDGDGNGHLAGVLKIKPAALNTKSDQVCLTKKVLGAVLGKHKAGYENVKMPLLKERLSLEEVYAVSEYIENFQK